MNQSLRTFVRGFVAAWKQKYGEELKIAIINETKQPDFTALEVGARLHIVEIKKPQHGLNAKDFERLQNYVVALRDFFEKHNEIKSEFSRGWQIDLVADRVALRQESHRESFESYESKKEVVRITWEDFITRAERANSEFLNVHHESEQVATGGVGGLSKANE